ncbi:MAG: glycosyltransferase family 4 protein [Desulfomonile tiedjei]|nr:glycosyltransferase family 4 protein [Desulfomonile tiedjei]
MTIKLVHVVTVPVTLKHLLRDQIAYMRGKGLQVVAVSSPGPMLEDMASRDGLEVHAVPMSRWISPFSDLVALWRLFRLFRKIRPTIVHGSTAKASVLAMAAAAFARVPIRFYTVRGLMTETRSGSSRHLLRALESVTCLLAQRVFPVSKSVAASLMSERLCSPHKISLLAHGSSNGVDGQGRFNPTRVTDSDRDELREQLAIPDNAFVIGFVGRIVKSKGVEELIEAWQSIRNRGNCFLLIIGHTEAQDPVSAATLNALQNDPRIARIAAVENSRMPSLYSIMSLLVLPTYREGFPNVVLEAAAMEVPTVATRVTGCVDAVKDGETGTLVPPREALSLANAIGTYLENRELRLRHGREARKRVLRDFQQTAIWDALFHEYMLRVNQKGLAHVRAGQKDPVQAPGSGGSR